MEIGRFKEDNDLPRLPKLVSVSTHPLVCLTVEPRLLTSSLGSRMIWRVKVERSRAVSGRK